MEAKLTAIKKSMNSFNKPQPKNDMPFDFNKLKLFKRPDRDLFDVNYEDKPLYFTFKDVYGSGILVGRNGTSKYIKFSIPYDGDNINEFKRYIDAYVILCTIYYSKFPNEIRKDESLSDFIKEGRIINDPFNIYSKDNINPNDKFTLFVTIFDNMKIKGVSLENITGKQFIGNITLKLSSFTGGKMNDDDMDPGRLNFIINEIKVDRYIESTKKEPFKYDANEVGRLIESLKIKK